MSLLQQAPRYDAAGAAQLARDLYGLDAGASPLPSERDQNFLLTTATGERFVLKIANLEETRDLLEAQDAAMSHAAEVGLCPRVLQATDGSRITKAGLGHFVRLLTWLPGTPLAEQSARPDALLEDLGRTLGRLSRALAGFDHPAIHRDFHWDLARGFAIVAEHAPLIADPELQGLVRRTVAHIQARDGERIARLRRSAVHGDPA